MITFKGQLKTKEEFELKMLIYELSDVYCDFYITVNNMRLYIRENFNLIPSMLKKGDKIAWGECEGIAFVTGFSDHSTRKYLKVLGVDNQGADKLIKVINHNVPCDLYCKIKNNNPVKRILQNNGFRFVAPRGKEILIKRNAYAERIN